MASELPIDVAPEPAQLTGWADQMRAYCHASGLVAPPGLDEAERAAAGTPAALLLYRLDADPGAPPHLGWALESMQRGRRAAPPVLLPVLPVDEASFACVICGVPDGESRSCGAIVRWHLDVPATHQAALLDTRVDLYVAAVAADLAARNSGLRHVLDQVGPAFKEQFLDQGRTPRSHELRPVRLACQNVIVGLAAFAYDSRFDGLRVEAWQTCEAPHLAAHEASRALTALMLCDAFQSGSRMELRFDRHPERAVPARLRQYARMEGIVLGGDDARAISPSEARRLIVAVTQMPQNLARRVEDLAAAGVLTLERACFALLAGIWDPLELDFLIATSDRTRSILRGGANPLDRPDRQAELTLCRAAVMTGTLFKRLTLGANEPTAAEPPDRQRVTRVLEDDRRTIAWRILDGDAALRLDGVRAGVLPWQGGGHAVALKPGQPLVVVPRTRPAAEHVELARSLANRESALAATLEPFGAAGDQIPRDSVARLVMPDAIPTLDRTIEGRLASARVGRK